MKCRKCGSPASINLRQHRLALCKKHFDDWFLQHTAGTIKKYGMFKSDERVLVAVSGGKDSLSLWDALIRLGYIVDGLIIDLGIDDSISYSRRSLEFTRSFAQSRGATLHELHIQLEYGETMPEIFHRSRSGAQKPCSTCGLVKRHELNRFAIEHGYTVLATGHNLDDEAAVLFSNTLTWNNAQLLRQQPVLMDSEKFARKVKPFVRFYERETTAYALLNGIEYIEEECPYSTGSTTNHFKTILNGMENEQPGMKYRYYNSFVDMKKTGFLKFSETRQYDENSCPKCGQLTSSNGLCAFCKLFD